MSYNPKSWYKPSKCCGNLVGHNARRCHWCGTELRPRDGRYYRHHTTEAKIQRLARKVKKILKEIKGVVD